MRPRARPRTHATSARDECTRRMHTVSAFSGSSSGARANTGANVGDQFTDIDVLECASEERWPERLELDIRSLNIYHRLIDGLKPYLEDGGDLVSGDLDVIIIEDKSGVGACQFSGHFLRNLF